MHRGGLFGIPVGGLKGDTFESVKSDFDSKYKAVDLENVRPGQAGDLLKTLVKLKKYTDGSPEQTKIIHELKDRVNNVQDRRKLGGTRKRKHSRRKNKTQRK